MGYSPWGHKESDKTELLTLSFLLRETHKPVFTWQRQGKTSLKETYPMWLVFVSCVFSLWYANILQLVLYFCSRYEVQPSTLLSRLCLCQQLQPPWSAWSTTDTGWWGPLQLRPRLIHSVWELGFECWCVRKSDRRLGVHLENGDARGGGCTIKSTS